MKLIKPALLSALCTIIILMFMVMEPAVEFIWNKQSISSAIGGYLFFFIFFYIIDQYDE